MLDVAGLGKRFGRVVVAEDVSFSVAGGEVLGVVGPNGAGKSTLLNLISGVLAPDRGSIRLGGHDVTRQGAAARARAGIGRTYQIPRPFAKMTVFENALVGATFAGRRRGEAADLAPGRPAADRTAGTRQRACRRGCGCSTASGSSWPGRSPAGPRCCCSTRSRAGWPSTRSPSSSTSCGSCGDEGVAVIWIEHVVHALLSCVDRLMCLAEGRVLAIGDPHEVMTADQVREVYLGTDPDLEAVQ